MEKVYDVCVIGSGPGGAPVAYELAKEGYDVVVLEKGKHFDEADFTKDELALRRGIYSPRLQDEFHVIYVKENQTYERYDAREYAWSFWNGCVVGGASNFMSGYFHRLKPNDFRLRSVYGDIEGANVADFPITYEELEPYYTKVEHIIGVSGLVVSHPFLEPRSRSDFPFAPLRENAFTQKFDRSCTALGVVPLVTPRAILSQDALGRSGCYYSNFCGSYGCASGAKGSSRAALLQQSSVEVRSEAFVYYLQSDKYSVQKAYYYDAYNQTRTVKAKFFVVAASPIETSRLLLNSKNRFFPNGLANNANQVGKNLIFSGGGVGSGTFMQEDMDEASFAALMEPGVFFNRSLQTWYEYEYAGEKRKGGTIDFLFRHANIIPRVKECLWDDSGNFIWGKALQARIGATLSHSRTLNFEVFNDWLPTEGTFVGIERGVKDFRGVEVASIYLDPHPRDIEVGEFLSARAMEVLEHMGARRISADISAAPPSNLVAGGCRFGDDPQTSVLDKNCRAWEVDNLFVSDASFLPTGGSVPYTWTIYANAFRVADVIKELL